MVRGRLGKEEVEESLSFLEEAMGHLGPDDDYLRAILHNQALMTRALQGAETPTTGNSNNVPPGTAGLALEGSSEGDSLNTLFKIDGRTVVSDLIAAREINEEEVVKVGSSGDKVFPLTNVSQSQLDFGKVGLSSENSTKFIFKETQNNVSIPPGQKKVVLDIDVSSTVGLFEIGTNDETHSLYTYVVDGENLIDKPIKKPLGLYNDRYDFPQPVKVESNLKVVVERQNSANSPADYFSNAVLM